MTTPVLEVTGLSRFFGGLPAVRDSQCAFRLENGGCCSAPTGPARRRSSISSPATFRRRRARSEIFGQNVTRKSANRRTHLGMARTYQIITLFSKNTLLHNVVISLVGLRDIRFNPWSDLRRQTPLWHEARATLALVGLEHLADRTVAETSYGERRRLESRWRSRRKPKLLLLDEPLAGLSADERQDVQHLLQSIPRDVTIVMIEHDMDVALAFADVITVMQHGQVVVEGSRADVVADPRTREVYLGH